VASSRRNSAPPAPHGEQAERRRAEQGSGEQTGEPHGERFTQDESIARERGQRIERAQRRDDQRSAIDILVVTR